MAGLYDDWFNKKRDEPYVCATGVTGSQPFLDLIPEKKRAVLVIGCGEGHEVNYLVKKGFRAVGVTANKKEVTMARKSYGVEVVMADMHQLPKNLGKFDTIFASNVLEHSPMPYLALLHWRKFLKKDGWVILGMPSKEWLGEYYHYSVLNRPQVRDLLYKAGFELLAGPQIKSKIDYHGGDIYYDLGRIWGFNDGYVARITALPGDKKMLGKINPSQKKKGNWLRTIIKWPYNKIRIWYWRNYREW